MLLATGCIGQREAPTATPTAATAPSVSVPSAEPSAEPSATPEPVATPVPTAEPPTETPIPPASGAPAASGQPGSATACTGTAANQDFFAKVAAAFDWPVYCAVLPAGWSIDMSGNTYALANGGRMVIGYHTNGGLHLELREGHWCTDSANACSPHDQDLGPIDIGDLHGELMSLGSGGYVAYVDPGEAPSWTFTGTGMDEGAFRKLIGDLALVRA